MAQTERFGLELAPINTDAYKVLAQRQQEVEATGLAAAQALARGEQTLEEASATIKAAAAESKQLAQAMRLVEESQRAAGESTAAAAAAVAESAAEYRQMAEAKARASSSDLAHSSEMEALAIQHETEMLAHEARQLAATEAAQDREIASLQQSITARERVEAESAQVAAALAKEAAARGGLTAAEELELASLQRSLAGQNLLESEAEQLTAALGLEENALYLAARATGSFTVEASAAASAQGKLATAAKTTRGGLSNLQQSITAGSYAFQDFTATSGDLGAKLNSISNNLPTLLIGLGGLGVGLSVAATAGIAIYRNWEQIAGFWEERNPFPKAAVDISGMKRELDAAKESLEKMEKAGSGNAAQLEKYNELRARTAELERDIADQTERQARTKKLMEAPSEEAEGRGKGFTEAVKGHGQETLDKIEYALDKRLEDERAAAWEAREAGIRRIEESNKTDEEKTRAQESENRIWEDTKKSIEARRAEIPARAADLMDKLAQGDEEAGKELDRLMAATGATFGDLKKRMDDANPHIKKLLDELENEVEEQIKAQDDAVKVRTKKEKEAAAFFFKELDDWVAEELKAARVDKTAHDAAHKIRLAASKAAADDAERTWKEAGKQEKAEAERVLDAAGKSIVEIFRDLVNNSLLPAEQAAAQLVAQFTQQFRAGGARPGAANLAARTVAARAGFDVAPPREVVGPAVPGRNTEAGKRIAAARKALAPEHAKARRQAEIARRKAAPALKRERAAKVRETRLARRRKPVEVDDDGPGLRSVAPTPVAAPGPQASIAPAVQGTQDAVAQTQAAQARDQTIVAALNARVRQLETNARRLNNRASEQAPTALNTGSSVA